MSWWRMFSRRKPSPEVIQARERLTEIEKDDHLIDEITRRTREILKRNHLGEDIKRALGGNR